MTKKSLRLMMGLAVVLALGSGWAQGPSGKGGVATDGEWETLKVRADMPFDGNAVGVPSEGAAAVPGETGKEGPPLTRSGALKAEASDGREVPATAPQDGPKGKAPRRGLKWWVGGGLLALAAVLLLTACGGKPVQDYTPAESLDLTVKAVRIANEATFKTESATQHAKNVANRHFGPGELQGNRSSYTYFDGENWVSVSSEHASQYELAIQSVQDMVRSAEGKVNQAQKKLDEAAMVAAKAGPEAMQAVTTARTAVLKARQALTEAREVVAAGPNSTEAKDAAQRAVELSKEASQLATQAQEIAAKAVAQ